MEKSYRSTKANLAKGNTTVVITLKVSGSLEVSSKTAGNVFWWQWKNGTNKHYCPSSKNGLSLELLLFLIAGKRTPNLRHMVMNTELLMHSREFVNKDGDHTNKIEGHWRHAKCKLPKFGVRKHLFSTYLAEFIWRYMHRDEDLFRLFLNDVKKCMPPVLQSVNFSKPVKKYSLMLRMKERVMLAFQSGLRNIQLC